ncbi:MAG: ABC transporter ATP-binding protein [Ardenticatenaceae bacterium]|nr:ABC transporter ATP-binding protein [Ardenticatenaceae bacterium]
MNSNYIVETHDLTKVYGDGEKVYALDGVTMHVEKGEIVAVMGPSGSGKSTLLHMIGALDRPTSGQVIVAGQDLATVKRLDLFRNRTVGFIFQLHNLIPTLTAVENVEVPLYEQKISPRQRRERAKELLELVGLGDRMKHLPGQLSGGQRQRVAIARALVNRPALVLADEPTGELDSERTAEIIETMHRLNQELGTTFVIVTHDPAIGRETRRIIELDSGRVLREHVVGDRFDEDWKTLRDSPLGQALLNDGQKELTVAGKPLYANGVLTENGRLLREMLSQLE